MHSRAGVKRMIIGALASISAAFSAGAFSAFSESGSVFAGYWGAGMLVIFLALFIIQNLIADRESLSPIRIAIALETLAFAWPLFTHGSLWFLALSILAFFLFLAAEERGRLLENDLCVMRFSMIARCILPLAVTAASIFGVMYFYEKGAMVKTSFVSALVEAAVRGAEPALQRFWGGASLEQPIEDFLGTLTKEKLQNSATQAEQEYAIREALARFQKNLAESFEITIAPQDSVRYILEAVVRKSISNMSRSTFGAFFIVLILFFVVRGIGAVLGMIARPVAWTFYKTLLASQFFTLQLEKSERERVVL